MDKSHHGRRDRLVKQKRHDNYRASGKLPDHTMCSDCGCLYRAGRWTWVDTPPKKPNMTTCPACQRIKDNYPAGYVELKGQFFENHYQEISNLITNEEKMEKTVYPLERIIAVTGENDSTLITTTGVHIAHRIGKALHRAYQGELVLNYGEGEKTIRVSWAR
ncbi:MAG: BCAM0308 family protein [Desulfobulbaceae bacterium]|nr:BCAM0308 family protein [Desulfobulbaceae bacterium]